MTCFFPDLDISTQASCGITTAFEEKENESSKRFTANLKFQKRGMKFAHGNVVTLAGHYADVEVLFENKII